MSPRRRQSASQTRAWACRRKRGDGGELVLYPSLERKVVIEPRLDRLVLFSGGCYMAVSGYRSLQEASAWSRLARDPRPTGGRRPSPPQRPRCCTGSFRAPWRGGASQSGCLRGTRPSQLEGRGRGEVAAVAAAMRGVRARAQQPDPPRLSWRRGHWGRQSTGSTSSAQCSRTSGPHPSRRATRCATTPWRGSFAPSARVPFGAQAAPVRDCCAGDEPEP